MNSLALQLASLVKRNNGYFKSEKQAKFFLDNVESDDYICMGGNMFGNAYTIFYHMDERGVYKVVKHLYSTYKDVITFERESDDAFRAKRIVYLDYSVKSLKERIEDFSLLSCQKREANYRLKMHIKSIRILENVPSLREEFPEFRKEFSNGHLNKRLKELIEIREECSKAHREEMFKELDKLKAKLEKEEAELNSLLATEKANVA